LALTVFAPRNVAAGGFSALPKRPERLSEKKKNPVVGQFEIADPTLLLTRKHQGLYYNMQKRSRKKQRPDLNELASAVVEAATETEPTEVDEVQPEDPTKNPKAVKSGHLGGIKGGKSRAQKLSAARRKEIARQAALARWRKSS